MVPETLKKLCITTLFFGKTFFAPKKWGQKCAKNAQKMGVLNLKKNFVINFHCIYSILKIGKYA